MPEISPFMSQDHQDQSPAVIDATDVQVLAPELVAPVLSAKQAAELNGCHVELEKLAAGIRARMEDVAYLWIESGFYLLKAQAVYRVSHDEKDGENGKFVAVGNAGERGFVHWFEQAKLGYSIATAYRYIQGACNYGLTEESTAADIEALRNSGRLAGKKANDICRKPKRHEPAAEIVQGTEQEGLDLPQAWLEHGHLLQEFYKGWAAATWHHLEEKQTWHFLNRREKESLRDQAQSVYQKIRDALMREDERKLPAVRAHSKKKHGNAEQAIDKSKQAPPATKRFRFEFEKPRGSRKLKGSRWFYGYQTPEGKIVLTVYRGKESEAEAEAFKKTLPDVRIVGPFYSKSLAYAKRKVKQALSDEAVDTSLSNEIEGETIFVP